MLRSIELQRINSRHREGSTIKSEICCIIGEASLPAVDELNVMTQTEGQIRRLIEEGVLYFGVAGSCGFCISAAKKLFWLKAMFYPEIKTILVYSYDGCQDRWPEEQKREYEELVKQYDKVVRVCTTWSKEASWLRDQHLIDCSGHCICYLPHKTGNAVYAAGYARYKGLDVANVAGSEYID